MHACLNLLTNLVKVKFLDLPSNLAFSRKVSAQDMRSCLTLGPRNRSIKVQKARLPSLAAAKPEIEFQAVVPWHLV